MDENKGNDVCNLLLRLVGGHKYLNKPNWFPLPSLAFSIPPNKAIRICSGMGLPVSLLVYGSVWVGIGVCVCMCVYHRVIHCVCVCHCNTIKMTIIVLFECQEPADNMSTAPAAKLSCFFFWGLPLKIGCLGFGILYFFGQVESVIQGLYNPYFGTGAPDGQNSAF